MVKTLVVIKKTACKEIFTIECIEDFYDEYFSRHVFKILHVHHQKPSAAVMHVQHGRETPRDDETTTRQNLTMYVLLEEIPCAKRDMTSQSGLPVTACRLRHDITKWIASYSVPLEA